ncbi:hypothetical protein EYF80_066247 [Liparis tanakae]|uniref:Uncharacterized protein n=1 Tax=Liparis tanakae TaxID=230148 RepID=A0A4Z2E4G7_9TELE|nr:hypothetical protein EYF80_066247 [Liparis tanakae]
MFPSVPPPVSLRVLGRSHSVQELRCPSSASLGSVLLASVSPTFSAHRRGGGWARGTGRGRGGCAPAETLADKKSAMAGVVFEGMPETAAGGGGGGRGGGGGGGMLNRRRSKARRRKRKELFAIQMCFAGVLLGLVVGLKAVAQKAGEGTSEKEKNNMFYLQ